MTNVTQAAYPLHQQASQGRGGYGGGGGGGGGGAPPPLGMSFQPSQFPFQQHPQAQQFASHHGPAPQAQPFYQHIHPQYPPYGNPQPQNSGSTMVGSSSQQPQSTYPSALFSQSVAPSSAPFPAPQIGATSYSASPRAQPQGTPTSAGNQGPGNMMQPRQPLANGGLAQQNLVLNQSQRPGQVPAHVNPVSPHSAARERARVTVLLEINTQLLQEVVLLQSQGKAGIPPNLGQQSPTKETVASPTSATYPSNALNNSPIDPSKPTTGKPSSPEYVECMRRLQANLSYLAAIADAKKKATGTIPSGPAIMAPPPHLAIVNELYKRLNTLFPSASQSTMSKAMAMASAQAAKAQAPVPGHG